MHRKNLARVSALTLAVLFAAAFGAAAFAQTPSAAPPQSTPLQSVPSQSVPSPSTLPQRANPAPAPVGPAPSTAAQSAPDAPAAPPAADSAGALPAPTPAPAPTIVNATLPHDLSPWGMFINADIVVKVVMIGLAVRLARDLDGVARQELRIVDGDAQRPRARSRCSTNARSLAEANARLGDSSDAVARLLRTAVNEVQMSPHPEPESLKERISWLLERVEAAAGRRIGRGMGLLATIGATAPFVGLFGTVWGIMNSFIGISKAHTTNLAVVAPGIAEALLATALGLVAAIPAVVIYNVFARSIGGYRALLARRLARW